MVLSRACKSPTLLLSCGIILVSLYSSTVTGQVLKRLDDIVGWAAREEKIFELSKARIKRLKSELNELEKFVDDYEKTTTRHISGIEDPELQEILKTNAEARAYVVASNAMLTYRMTHRLSTMIARMQRVMLSTDPEEQELKEVLGAFTDVQQHPNVTLEPVGETFGKYYEWLPIEDDLEGALDAMTVLYDVYNPELLGPDNFAAVISTGTTKPVQINAYHATKFSLKAFYHGYYGNAIDWANYARDKLEKERDYSISKELVHYMREFMGKSHNEEIGRPPSYFPEIISYMNFFTELVNETQAWQKRRSVVQKALARGKNVPVTGETTEEEKTALATTSFYYSTCQNARKQLMKNAPIGQPSKLKCLLDRRVNPFWYLAPLKVEIISKYPNIRQFYDVLTPSELEGVLEEVKQQQFAPPYQLKEFPDEFGTRKPHLRVTVDAILDKQLVRQGGSTGALGTLARKTEYLTGFQILDSGVGALYPGEKYNDVGFRVSEIVGGGYEAIQTRKEGDEDQFAGGIQIYLQEPKEGGEIVFGGAKTLATPVMGSAIVWDNIGRDKITPVDTQLGSCPVVHGNKIVVSKTFLYSLNPFAQF